MKKQIDGILVVEGKSDVSFLSNYIDTEFVITNGSEISKETIDYLKNSNKKIYVLTDPDSPGKRIRDVLDHNIPNLNHCFINKESSIKHGKVGVAEGNIEEILESLDHALTTINRKTVITTTDLVELKLIGCEKADENRELVSKKLHLGYCNGKTLLKRLNYLGINKEKLEELLR